MRWVLALLSMVLVAPAAAQDDPLVAVTDADPLLLARAAQRMGDAEVLGRLSEETHPEARLAAIRATPWLAAPERALSRLAELAHGRDPDLAPAAAAAALEIARKLEADDLAAREVSASLVEEAASAMRAVGDDEGCRRDIRRAGLLTADLLRSLLVQS